MEEETAPHLQGAVEDVEDVVGAAEDTISNSIFSPFPSIQL